MTFNGIFEVMGSISAANYQQLASNPLVFIPDVTGSLVYSNAKFQRATDLSWDQFVAELQISSGSGSPFWFMEELGLANFLAD